MDENSLDNFVMPENIGQLKGLYMQFKAFIPEDKQLAIENTINDIESTGGIKDSEQAKKLIVYLLQNLGLI